MKSLKQYICLSTILLTTFVCYGQDSKYLKIDLSNDNLDQQTYFSIRNHNAQESTIRSTLIFPTRHTKEIVKVELYSSSQGKENKRKINYLHIPPLAGAHEICSEYYLETNEDRVELHVYINGGAINDLLRKYESQKTNKESFEGVIYMVNLRKTYAKTWEQPPHSLESFSKRLAQNGLAIKSGTSRHYPHHVGSKWHHLIYLKNNPTNPIHIIEFDSPGNAAQAFQNAMYTFKRNETEEITLNFDIKENLALHLSTTHPNRFHVYTSWLNYHK